MLESKLEELEKRKAKLEKKRKVPVFIDNENEELYIVDGEGNTVFV